MSSVLDGCMLTAACSGLFKWGLCADTQSLDVVVACGFLPGCHNIFTTCHARKFLLHVHMSMIWCLSPVVAALLLTAG
jgi:hypothetical protein